MGSLKSYVIPSLIATTQSALDERFLVARKTGAKVMQLDVMDGRFVKNESLNFDFKLPAQKDITYEAHLMMYNPMPWIYKHHKKVDLIIVHYESPFFKEAVNFIRHHNKKVGVALNPKTSFEHYESLDFTFVDTILIMTVHPGKYGAKFLPKMIEKVKEAREKYPKLHIEVDGGVSNVTIRKLSKKTYMKLKKLIA